MRSDKGLIVAAPSIHSSGNSYQWREGLSPFDIAPVNAPEWLHGLMEEGADKSSETTIKIGANAMIAEGNRNNYLTSLAGTLRRRGLDEDVIITTLLAENKAKLQPPIDEKEVISIAKSISRYEPDLSSLKSHYNKTDSGNAERFLDLYGADIRYCHAFKKWYLFNGCYWKKDETSEITQYAIHAVRSMFGEASRIENEDARRELVKHALKSEGNTRIKSHGKNF